MRSNAVVLPLIVALATPLTAAEPERLAPKRFQAKLADLEDENLIDVRTAGERQDGIIEASRRLTVTDDDFEERLAELPRDRPLFLYCFGGTRSGRASEIAQRLGFETIYDLAGGLSAWKDDGLPTTDPPKNDE